MSDFGNYMLGLCLGLAIGVTNMGFAQSTISSSEVNDAIGVCANRDGLQSIRTAPFKTTNYTCRDGTVFYKRGDK